MTITDYTLTRTADSHWLCVDASHGIQVTWEDHQYTETQQVTCSAELGPRILQRHLRQMKEWLMYYHIDTITTPTVDDLEQCARRRIGAELKQAREEQGLSMAEVAERADLGKSHIARVEAGRYNVTIDTLAVISHALGKQISAIPR